MIEGKARPALAAPMPMSQVIPDGGGEERDEPLDQYHQPAIESAQMIIAPTTNGKREVSGFAS